LELNLFGRQAEGHGFSRGNLFSILLADLDLGLCLKAEYF